MALSLRQEGVKDELLRMRQQQLIAARKERREELRAQVKRLEMQVDQYERFPESSERLIERLVHQNEQIMALLLPRRHDADNVLSTERPFKPPLSPNSPTKENANAQTKWMQFTDAQEPSTPTIQPESHSASLSRKVSSTLQTPSPLSWLPEFEWTDEDEMTLGKLENDEDIATGSDVVGSSNNAKESDATANTVSANTSTSNEQKARERLESRKRLEALLNASLKNASSGALRKPRWRLESEAESDEVSPFGFQDAEAMEPLQIFRSAVRAVMYTLCLKKLLMNKKMAEKESAIRDFEAMLRVYFDATRMWLGKVVRTPLLSLIQDPSVDVDISTKNGLAGSSLRGFAKKFGGILARRPPVPALPLAGNGHPIDSAVDPAKLLKLKVHMRGVLQSLGKAIDKKEVPFGIMDFWKRISTDGVYFPPSYQLFDEERRSLEFDPLGATRRMDFDGTSLLDSDEHGRSGEMVSVESGSLLRFNVVVINFLLVRILIPHVILQPWNVGIGPKSIGKQASANLANLATLLYYVCKQLSPLPQPPEPVEFSFLGRRRSKTVAISRQNASDKVGEPDESIGQPSTAMADADPALAEPESVEVECSNPDTSFLSIEEICRRLISGKKFPTQDAEVINIIKEHQATLQATLTNLRFQLHSSQEKR
ncbi:uncharacterized protein KRP23_6274 [Phytophthora ramorum]|uniref:uncharacterized protein n=1 Tax=Phytophthora ramorum TaxID=164328 RepID=UPI0030A91A40|nr:hypothetical protein KRP23_6274 [Phytophthora ramorum]